MRKNLARRSLAQSLTKRVTRQSEFAILNFSPSRISLEEIAWISFKFRDIPSHYNKKRHLLILEFNSAESKLRFTKQLPQWLWNRGCVVFEYTPRQLNTWLTEAIA